MSDVTTRHIASFDGQELALHEVGPADGPAMVLLHGLFSDAHVNWIKYGTADRVAMEGYRLIMPDLRGHGQSARPTDPAAWPEDVLVRDIAHVIAELGLADYDLGGFSLGARTTARLVGQGAMPKRAMLAGMGLQGLTGWGRRRGFFDAALDAFDTAKRGDPHWLSIQFMKTQKVDPAMARLLLNSIPETAIVDPSAISLPTLVLCGDQDQDNGSAAALAEALPQGEHVTVPGTHMSSVTKPEFGAAIAEWFGTAEEA